MAFVQETIFWPATVEPSLVLPGAAAVFVYRAIVPRGGRRHLISNCELMLPAASLAATQGVRGLLEPTGIKSPTASGKPPWQWE